MARFTLGKDERLASQKAIESLFESGESLTCHPVRLLWKQANHESKPGKPVQVMFSAGKKKFPRAVDRNRLKRLMRESYRHLKPGLYENLPASAQYYLAILFIGNSVPGLPDIQKGITLALERWLKKIKTENE